MNKILVALTCFFSGNLYCSPKKNNIIQRRGAAYIKVLKDRMRVALRRKNIAYPTSTRRS